MKTLLTVVLVSLMGISVYAGPGTKADYIVTKDGKCVIAKVQFGVFKMHAKQGNGDILKLNYKDVTTFQKNGEIFEKKPLYNENRNSGSLVFMKLLSWRNGYSLYCYDEPASSMISIKRYFVFKDGNNYWLEVDQRNSETISTFFSRVSQE